MAIEDRLKDIISDDDVDAHVDPWQIIQRGRRRRRRTPLLAGFAALVLVVAVGVGIGTTGLLNNDGSTRSRVQPATGDDKADQDAAVIAAYEQKLRAWASCLQQHGVPVDTPAPGSADSFFAGLAQFKGEPTYEAAAEACSDLLPIITPELERAWGQNPDPSPNADQVQKLRDYADCMHENGAATFPTPGPDGVSEQQWQAWNGAAEGEQEQAATHICGPLSF